MLLATPVRRAHSRLSRLAGGKLFTQFSAVLSGRVVGAVCQAAAILLLARWVGVESFGVCMALLGLLTVLQTVGDVGATAFILKEVAAVGHNARVSAAGRMSAWSTGGLAMAGALICLLLALRGHRDLLLLLPLWGWLVLERVTEVNLSVAIGLQRASVVMSSLVLRRILSLAAFCSLYALDVPALLAFSLGYLAGSALALPILRAYWKWSPPSGASLHYRQVFEESRHFWMHSVAIQARNADALLITLVSGPAQAAFYGLGARLLTPLRMVPAALASIVLPHAARYGGDGISTKRLLILISVLAVPYLALAAAWPLIIPQLFDASYAASIPPLQIMSLVLSISSCTSIISALLQGRGQGSQVSRISAVTTVGMLVFVMLGAMAAGATGASLGFAIGSLAHVALLARAYLREQRNHG